MSTRQRQRQRQTSKLHFNPSSSTNSNPIFSLHSSGERSDASSHHVGPYGSTRVYLCYRSSLSSSTQTRYARVCVTDAQLGEYMLRGYTLTDLSCDSCGVTPLMREPTVSAQREGRAPIQFCALCDGRPENATASGSNSTPNIGPSTSTSTSNPADGATATRPISSSSITDDIPAYTSPFDAPITSSSSALTSQADKAAGSISSLLLQGYSLLGTNCPNPICRGIPLVGYPKKKDGTKDGRRICVSCNGAWVDQADLEGMKVVPPTAVAAGSSSGAARILDVPRGISADETVQGRSDAGVESPRSKARRELYEEGDRIVQATEAKKKKANEPVSSFVKGKRVESESQDEDEDQDELDLDQEDTSIKPISQDVKSVSRHSVSIWWILMSRFIKTTYWTRLYLGLLPHWQRPSNRSLRLCNNVLPSEDRETTTRGILSMLSYIQKPSRTY